ncbi:hypothetical protein [Amaricoccus solimangrovi]|uniref:Uncharacterized protein n=1 Tax=Amaricoccus solimangrovi TaxID=2589815 RepID=A0A501W3W0_9RHOB|nr:hypothetical protein [Amaricoccus solimangrovi]TPE44603.1 hypothetical protein FJM51_22885 [Amaricoccus solimangrovi]
MKRARWAWGSWIALGLSVYPAAAQQGPSSLTPAFDAETIYRGNRDLDGGGAFSVSRNIVGVGVSRSLGGRDSIGLNFGAGVANYDFDDVTAPWSGIRELSLSLPVVFRASRSATVVAVPVVRYAGEGGVDLGDGATAGLIVGASWRFSDSFSAGPGFGAFTRLAPEDGYELFPFLLVDWRITERLTLDNGRGFGASRGPGVGLNYELRDDLSAGLFVRFDSTEFRLDDHGPAPGGIGEDKATAVVATAAYRPGKGLDLTGFLGMEVGGQLTLKDSAGETIDKRDYDPAPILGAKLRHVRIVGSAGPRSATARAGRRRAVETDRIRAASVSGGPSAAGAVSVLPG